MNRKENLLKGAGEAGRLALTSIGKPAFCPRGFELYGRFNPTLEVLTGVLELVDLLLPINWTSLPELYPANYSYVALIGLFALFVGFWSLICYKCIKKALLFALAWLARGCC